MAAIFAQFLSRSVFLWQYIFVDCETGLYKKIVKFIQIDIYTVINFHSDLLSKFHQMQALYIIKQKISFSLVIN